MGSTRTATALALATLVFLAVVDAGAQRHARDFDAMREKMVEEVRGDMRRVRDYVGSGDLSPAVLEALSNVERHLFVPESWLDRAYDNGPLPIGEGQTISQPFIVALMTDLLGVDTRSKVLELGTGSGYQAAILAEIVDEVFTIEIVAPLGEQAAFRLDRLGYHNVHVRIGDGTGGWPEEAPFDAIIVTAAGVEIPEALMQQLKVGGRLVIPVGPQNAVQQLMVITRDSENEYTKETTIPVRFVPITGDNAG